MTLRLIWNGKSVDDSISLNYISHKYPLIIQMMINGINRIATPVF